VSRQCYEPKKGKRKMSLKQKVLTWLTGKELPITDEERFAIWKWIRENCLDKNRDEIAKAVNDYFFDGQAKQKWIDDILSGRKTPFQKEVKGLWKAKHKKEKAIQEALSTVTRMAKHGK
jgi:hypothetical protein